jgi:methylated-DNA-[protein]-cysteine S-methyltransferase
MSDKKITPFAKSVYSATKLIPKGKVTTYKLIAKAINKPNAYRAVGIALSKNPYAPKVPCHRVIKSNYTIGGFYGNDDINSKNVNDKLKLLKKEGIIFDDFNKIKNCKVYKKNITHTF